MHIKTKYSFNTKFTIHQDPSIAYEDNKNPKPKDQKSFLNETIAL